MRSLVFGATLHLTCLQFGHHGLDDDDGVIDDGHLAVDTRAHFIEDAYGGSVSDKLPAPSSADGLTDAQKPAAVNGLVGSGTDQPLVIPPTGPAPDTYVLMYSMDGGLTWSVRIPYGREPGRYTVKAKYMTIQMLS